MFFFLKKSKIRFTDTFGGSFIWEIAIYMYQQPWNFIVTFTWLLLLELHGIFYYEIIIHYCCFLCVKVVNIQSKCLYYDDWKNIFTCITYMILIEPLNVCRFLILVNVDSLTDPGLLMNLHLNRSTKTVQKRNQTHN